MKSLTSILNRMLLVWLALVLAMGYALGSMLHGENLGRLVEVLFSNRKDGRPYVAEQMPAPAKSEESARPVEPKPVPDWVSLQQGSTKGAGRLELVSSKTDDDGAFVVTFSISGRPGDVVAFRLKQEPSTVLDLLGQWDTLPFVHRKFSEDCLRSLKVARHENFLRIKGRAPNGRPLLDATAEYSAAKGLLRVVFKPVN